MGSDGKYDFDVMTPKTYAFGAVLILLGAVGVYMMVSRPDVNPLLIIFFYSIPSNSAISIFPHEPVLIWYGKTVNCYHLSIAATLGTILAAFIDYRFFAPFLNLSYSAKYKSAATYKTANKWFYKMPFVSLVAAGFSPIPFFPFKFMVYASKYPLWKYISAIAIGRFPRYFLLAYAGFALQIPNWIIFGSFAVMIVLIYYKKIVDRISRATIWLYRFTRGDKTPTGD